MQTSFLPCARLLAESPVRRDRHAAGQAFYLLGDCHDLNGAPRAAIRSYQRALRLDPKRADAWREIAAMLENMGELKRARRALLRAQSLARRDDLIVGDLERVEWAMFNRVPAMYGEGSWLWEASEQLAARRPRRALAIVGCKRVVKARLMRARCHGALGDSEGVVREFAAIGKANGTNSKGAHSRGAVQLRHADWYYTFQGSVANSADLWKLMLWKIRRKLEGGCFNYPTSLWDIDVSEAKRFELYARFQLARCESDPSALLALAGKYPSWREPGEWALRLG